MLEKFKQIIKKEILYFFITFIVLALIMHIDLLNNPLERLDLMQEKENFSHPFTYTFIVYGLMLIIRKVIDFVVGLFEKKSH